MRNQPSTSWRITAVNAPVFAAPIWIKRPIEWHIRRLGNLIDDALRSIEKDLPLDALRRAVSVLPFDPLPIDLFAQDMQPDRFKTIAGIQPRSAPMRRTVGQRIAV